MIIWKIAEILLGVVLGIGLIVCIADWMRKGCQVPRQVHFLAGIFLFAGSTVGLYYQFALDGSFKVTAMWIAVPPLWAYVGWLLMFGPWVSDEKKRTKS